MRELRALSYADRRALINALAALRKRPWRALIWVVWLVLIAGFGWLQTTGPGARHGPAPAWQIGLQDLWACGFAGAAGIVLASGSERFAGFFASRAEALMLVRAPLDPLLIAAYLQARTIATTLARALARFAYVILIGFPARVTPLGLLRELALVAAATIALTSLILPRALARGAWRVAAIAAGCALVLGAVLPLLRDVLQIMVRTPAALALARRLPSWHPGLVFDAVAGGALAPVGWALLVALVCGTLFVLAARDAYPELYALSLAHIELRARLSTRRTRGQADAHAGGATRAVSARAVLRGALAFVWLDVVTWPRRVAPAVSGLIAAFALAAGVALGFLAHSDTEAATVMILTLLPNVTIAIASAAGIRLAADLRRPLFWLGDVTLFGRLAGWTYASLWRDAAFFGLAALGFGVLTGAAALAVTLLGVALGLAVLTRAVGTAMFALLPNALDQRGPAVLLRLVLAYALVAPAAAVAAGIGYLSRSLPAASGTGLLLAGAEAGLLIGFAAWRLAGRVDALGTA